MPPWAGRRWVSIWAAGPGNSWTGPRAGFGGDWRKPYATPGVDLLTEWVRWLGEESGLPEALIEQALGGDHG
jgi:hypothetical protein